MFQFAQLLVSALLATTVLAAPAAPSGGVLRPIVNQGVAKVFNPDDMTELVKADYARARSASTGTLAGDVGGSMSSFAAVSKNGTSSNAVGSAHATNNAIYYTTAVQVGNPSLNYQLIIDTGSANTWVGAKTKYVKTSGAINTGSHMVINYQSAQMQGYLYYDKVSLSSTITVPSQAIGVASSQRGFDGTDGVLGLGPKRLSRGTTSQGTSVELPTITDNLWQKKVITDNVVSLSFAPANQVGTINGQITFGGVDSTRYNSKLTYAPLCKEWPCNSYWGVDAASIAYGTTQLFTQTSIPSIIETGLTLIYFSSDAFKKYQSATGAVMDTKTGLLKATTAQVAALKTIDITVAGVKYPITPNAQLWPRSLNTAIGGAAYNNYLVIADLGTKSGSGLDVILGQKVVERLYFTFDSTNKRVGMATTAYTNSTIN